MIFAFYFFAAVLVFLSFKSLIGGIEYLRFFRCELAKPRPAFTPFVTIIVPCRGLDEGLTENLLALVRQDYPVYEIIFVVDDENDPAVPVISKFLHLTEAQTQAGGTHKKVKTKLVVAQKSVNSGQKVENLREAFRHAEEGSEAFVFTDSDARPSSRWLLHLIAPLADKKTGATTGYRWFIATNPGFASELQSVWNASIASALGPNTKSNFCWGGSMAIRRDTFERLGISERWKGTVSDDFTLTRVMNEAEMSIVFVPQALTASVEDRSFGEMLEFTTRQMKITRVYAKRLWLQSFLGSGIFIFVMTAAFLIVVLSGKNDFAVWAAIATLSFVTAFSAAKSYLRLKAVRLALPEFESELRKQILPQAALWPLSPVIFFYNCVAALISRRVKWRGTVYELKSSKETVIIAL